MMLTLDVDSHVLVIMRRAVAGKLEKMLFAGNQDSAHKR